MLKLVVQPIVENAIKHGISSLSRMGKITIKATLVEHDIVIEVSDDGVGFNPPSDILEKNPSKQRQLGGYGLINVNDRIKLEYGPNYGISVESTMDIGTKVTIRLAARI
jgi:two-component system sensor histidine kinase YesM